MTGLWPLIDVLITGDDMSKPKPHPEGVRIALELLRVHPTTAIMLGDSGADIEAGRRAGISTIGALYGMEGENIKKHNPDFLISHISETARIVLW